MLGFARAYPRPILSPITPDKVLPISPDHTSPLTPPIGCPPSGFSFAPSVPWPSLRPSLKNHYSGTRAPIAPCLSLPAKYSFTSMTVAGARLTFHTCRNSKISRRYSPRVVDGNRLETDATFQALNVSGRSSESMARVQRYARFTSIAKSCTQPDFSLRSPLRTPSAPRPAKAAMGAAE